jgi:DNA polymerase-3 subunit epsilon
MPKIPFDRFAFFDFEASSLDANSWPIDVGLSWVTSDYEVKTHESLIMPSLDWF